MARKYYYNGVLLPEIPADVLAEYPYAAFGFDCAKGNFHLLLSKDSMHISESVRITRNNVDIEPYFYCYYGDNSWTTGTAGNYAWSINNKKILIWANHDLPKGSQTATTIYLYGTESVPEYVPSASNTYYQIGSDRLTGIANHVRRLSGTSDPMTPAQMQSTLAECSSTAAQAAANSGSYAHIVPTSITGDKCYYGDELLPGFPAEMLQKYPYAWLLKRTDTGIYLLIFTTKPCYVADAALYPDAGSLGLRYTVALASADTATEWAFHSVWNGGTTYKITLDDAKTVAWSNYDIPNGSPDSEDVYFYGSAAVPAEQEGA